MGSLGQDQLAGPVKEQSMTDAVEAGYTTDPTLRSLPTLLILKRSPPTKGVTDQRNAAASRS